jgi:transcription termination/antitermination factor NusG
MGEDLPVRVFDMEIGDNVNLLEGSFVDMVGKIIQIDRENERVVVEFELFGRQQSVTTDFSKVKKAD